MGAASQGGCERRTARLVGPVRGVRRRVHRPGEGRADRGAAGAAQGEGRLRAGRQPAVGVASAGRHWLTSVFTPSLCSAVSGTGSFVSRGRNTPTPTSWGQ